MARNDIATSVDQPQGQPRRIGIFLFDLVEEVDAIGRWEGFAWWGIEYAPDPPYRPVPGSREWRPMSGAYGQLAGDFHRHGLRIHAHPHAGSRRHGRRRHSHTHGAHPAQAHSHGLVHDTIKRPREGLTAVGLSLAVLGATALAQAVIFVLSGSVALLADLIHNFGDAATAIPLGVAFNLAIPEGGADRRAVRGRSDPHVRLRGGLRGDRPIGEPRVADPSAPARTRWAADTSAT